MVTNVKKHSMLPKQIGVKLLRNVYKSKEMSVNIDKSAIKKKQNI